MQSPSLKLTIKLKPEKNADNPLTTVDHPNNVEGRQFDLSSKEVLEKNHSNGDEENEKSRYQLVLYDPNIANRSIEIETVQVGATRHRSRPHPFSNQTSPSVLSSVGAFTVQCANCFKWRLIPTKEKYEVIREHIIEQPFVCEMGREWRPNITCEDPPDMTQDGSRLWAIDKPNIAQPPPGWERLLRIRCEGSSKFADVYYVAPSGKRLRSMVEVQRYLNEHPEYVEGGVSLSRFSFQTPRPLRENYVRKRPAQAAFSNDAGDNGTPASILPPEVQPIAWESPDSDAELQLSGPGLSTKYSKSRVSSPKVKSAKKKRGLSKRTCKTDLVNNNQNDVNVGESRQL
ncbi:methyl-CpG-binding domain-containing protein [Castilleja foliolosa]|uniref:Methyl-CpG-binding domain-containing protein n=1 Tax=Castilleja foliolosa TaxID=1961234 RepID=A0ABD3C6R9_9LAMI